MTIIDNAIGIFSPARMLQRKELRARAELFDSLAPARDKLSADLRKRIMNQAGIHKGAKTRDYTNWGNFISTNSADDDNIDDSITLRDRTRELVRDNGIAAGAAETLVSNIIGGGIMMQSSLDRDALGIGDDEADNIERAMDRVWKRWINDADVSGRWSFGDIQRISLKQAITTGDFLNLIMRKNRVWSPYATSIMTIDPNRLDHPGIIGSQTYKDADNRGGVEIGELGEPIAYWIEKPRKYNDHMQKEFSRIPARDKYGRPNVLHSFVPDRPGQSKGISWFSPVIDLFKQLDEYMEAELIGARVAACFAVFIKKTNPYQEGLSMFTETDSYGFNVENLTPGLVSYLGTNEDISIANPQRPGVTFDPFVSLMLRIVSVGTGIPYELIINKWDGASYSVARTVLLEARRKWRIHQKWVSRTLCNPVWQLVMEEAWLRGELPMINDFYAKRHLWTAARAIPEGWQWVDPEKEVNAAIKAVDSGLSTLSDEAGAHGRDWESNLEQRGREERKRRALGVVNHVEEAEVDNTLSEIGLPLDAEDVYTRYGRAKPSGPDAGLKRTATNNGATGATSQARNNRGKQ